MVIFSLIVVHQLGIFLLFWYFNWLIEEYLASFGMPTAKRECMQRFWLIKSWYVRCVNRYLLIPQLIPQRHWWKDIQILNKKITADCAGESFFGIELLLWPTNKDLGGQMKGCLYVVLIRTCCAKVQTTLLPQWGLDSRINMQQLSNPYQKIILISGPTEYGFQVLMQ